MIQSVDVGEATIGVFGIVAVLDGKIETGARVRDSVIDYPKRIDELARQLVTGETIKDRYRPFDQKKIRQLFTDDPTEAITKLNAIRWVDHAAAMGQTLRLRNMINATRPQSQIKTLFAVKDLPVASFTWYEFEDILGLLDDPLSMFGAIKSGRITRKLVGLFEPAYASVYEAMAGSIVTHAVNEYAKKASFDLPVGVEASLSTFLSVDGIGDKVAAAMGTPKQQGQKGKPPSEVHHTVSISLAPKSAALESKD